MSRPLLRFLRLVAAVAVGAVLGGVAFTGLGVAGSGFSDVPGDHPFRDDITWMDEQGISTGYPDGTFRPGDVVTRQAMAAFMRRYNSSFTTGATWVNPPLGVAFASSASCPSHERPIAGGGDLEHANTFRAFLTRSEPEGDSWHVEFVTSDGSVQDATGLNVHVTCAPELGPLS